MSVYQIICKLHYFYLLLLLYRQLLQMNEAWAFPPQMEIYVLESLFLQIHILQTKNRKHKILITTTFKLSLFPHFDTSKKILPHNQLGSNMAETWNQLDMCTEMLLHAQHLLTRFCVGKSQRPRKEKSGGTMPSILLLLLNTAYIYYFGIDFRTFLSFFL